MKINKKKNPVYSLLIKLLSHSEDHEQYTGDIEELYNKRKKRNGTFQANLYLLKQITKSIPYFIYSSFYWGITMLLSYIKIAFRNILKYKLNSSINIFGMAIALAVCFLILLFVQDELSYDQFHKQKERIVRLMNNDNPWLSPNEAKIFKNNFPEVEEAVRLLPREGIQIQYENKKFIENNFTYADTTFFKVFTFEFVQGDEKTALSLPNSVVITKKIAKKYFEKDNPIGKRIKKDNEEIFTVTAVVEELPHNSHMHYNIIASIVDDEALFGKEWANNWGWRNFPTYLLLREKTAKASLCKKFTSYINNTITNAPQDEKPDYSMKNITDIYLNPGTAFIFQESHSDIKYVIIFSSIALFILLIACFNYINILTANATTRLKEVGVKKVIGATRKQLSRQFLIEAIMQFLFAFFLALLIVALTLPSFNTFTSKELLFSSIFSYETALTIFTIMALTVLIAGVYPARLISSFQPATIIKGFKTKNSRSSILRKSLLVIQYSISIVLIISATIMLRQIDFLFTTDLGYNKDQAIMCEINDNPKNPKYNSLKEALLQNASISFVSAASRLPSTDLGNRSYLQKVGTEKGRLMGIVHTDYDYFETFGIKPVKGRLFNKVVQTDAEESLILNESAAKLLGLGENPIGKMVSESWRGSNLRVIGIVPDFHFESLYTEITPTAFVIDPDYCGQMVIKMKAGNISNTLKFIDETWSNFYPDWLFSYRFLDENYAVQYEADQKTFQLMVYFTILAVFIASLGLFGMITYSARSRIKEIGVRKILGASIPAIIRILTTEYIKWILAAFIIGAPVALYFSENWLQNFAYRISISAMDLIVAALLIIFISFLTVIWQGVKASTANPVDALKYE
jgi:putative ABC transport system permease protein